jgi:NitT/TauT family transport system substrate-binding protein
VIYAKKTSAKVEDVKASLKDWDGTFVTDPNVIISPVLDYAKFQYDLGYIKKPLAQSDLFDLSFYKKVKG